MFTFVFTVVGLMTPSFKPSRGDFLKFGKNQDDFNPVGIGNTGKRKFFLKTRSDSCPMEVPGTEVV